MPLRCVKIVTKSEWYRIIILSCSLPEKKDELGVLAIFFFSPSTFSSWMACLHVYVYAFVIRMKNLKIM
jgi:hypothetical protein